MATLCKNCGRPVKFDPASQKLTCDFCGSSFYPTAVKDHSKDILEKIEPKKIRETSDPYMDCYVHTCNSCGGEIVINGQDVSTTCIYCGSPSVVFNRVAKQRRPDRIIPFKITREQALSVIKKRFKQGSFVPKELKNIKASDIRGVYIPYWLIDAEQYGVYLTYAVVGDVRMHLKSFPIEASSLLPNACSENLEPYSLKQSQRFDENYLIGFYSSLPDIDYGELESIAQRKTEKLFSNAAFREADDHNVVIVGNADPTQKIRTEQEMVIDYSTLRSAMFPAWFVTYRYEDNNYVIMVNGQTGKVVGGIPWNKSQIWPIILATTSTVLAAYFLLMFFSRSQDLTEVMLLVSWIGAVCVVLLFAGIVFLRRASRKLEETGDPNLFSFMRRRRR